MLVFVIVISCTNKINITYMFPFQGDKEVLPALAAFGVCATDAGHEHLQLLHGISCYFHIIFIKQLLKKSNEQKKKEKLGA